MKKIFSVLLSLLMLMSVSSQATMAAFAESTATVYMTITDGSKNFKLVREPIKVNDVDNDSKLTFYDAFYCAHETKYGSASGFQQSGGFITKFWGVSNGGSYGYYINDQMAMGLFEPISGGDYIKAFIYSDAAGYSDAYSFFDKNTVNANTNENITLNLSKYDYDPVTFDPYPVALKGATIMIDGKETEYVTDNNGNVNIKILKPGTHMISAKSNATNIVPPLTVINVSGQDLSQDTTDAQQEDANITNSNAIDGSNKSPNTGATSLLAICALAVGASSLALFGSKKSNKDEK